MADLLGMDPARIARLRSPERLRDFDPEKIWQELPPAPDCTMLDIGCGVGFVTLPFARRFPAARVVGCDILAGMTGLLAQAAAAEGLANLEVVTMSGSAVGLPDASADLIVMAQVHHELDAPAELLAECRRLLRPGGHIAIVDWKDEDNGKSPPPGRRVPEAVLRQQLSAAGFEDVRGHDVYRYHQFLSARG